MRPIEFEAVDTRPPSFVLPLDRDAHARAADGLPEPLAARARRGFEAFERLPMPTPKDEEWRYVEVDFDIAGFALPSAPGTPMEQESQILGEVEGVAGKAVSVDGFTIAAEGSDGIVVASLAEAPESVFAGLEFPEPRDRVAALNDAFSSDGVAIHAPAGAVVEGPVVVDLQATRDGALSVPTIVVRADSQAAVSVLVDQRSPDDVSCLAVPRIEVLAADAARVDVTVVQSWGAGTIAVADHRMTAGRDAFVGLAEVGLGGRFSRLALDVELVGTGADTRILGIYFGNGDQTLDYRYLIRHAGRSTTSEMFLKGAVGDTAKSVFSGLIRIEPEGQKANAHQTNRNLVLSEGAEAHSVPNLEILANDVRCGHGSAVGPLDEDQRYYLMSRGLTKARADRVQVRGFFEEVLRRLPIGVVAPLLRDEVLAKYERVIG